MWSSITISAPRPKPVLTPPAALVTTSSRTPRRPMTRVAKTTVLSGMALVRMRAAGQAPPRAGRRPHPTTSFPAWPNHFRRRPVRQVAVRHGDRVGEAYRRSRRARSRGRAPSAAARRSGGARRRPRPRPARTSPSIRAASRPRMRSRASPRIRPAARASPSRARSPRRFGAMPPMPPSWMPIEAMFANPVSA